MHLVLLLSLQLPRKLVGHSGSKKLVTKQSRCNRINIYKHRTIIDKLKIILYQILLLHVFIVFCFFEFVKNFFGAKMRNI